MHGFYGLICGGKKYRTLLEGESKEHFGIKHVFFVSSGKAALALILLALRGLSKKKRVIIPAYTCFSVPSSILKAGLEIVLCDIDPVTFDFDRESLKEKITQETLCVLTTHLFGIPADVEGLNKLCAGKEIFVVEDSAQAMGGEHSGRKLGTIGDVGFFSLGRGKNITCGTGGIIVTDNDSIAEAVARQCDKLKETSLNEDVLNFLQLCLMSVFTRPSLYWLPAAMPLLKLGETIYYRDFPIHILSARRATLLRRWRDRLRDSNSVRAKNALELADRVGKPDLRNRTIPYLRFPILVKNKETRELIYGRSKAKGLGLSLMYPTPVNEIEAIRANFPGQMFPGAQKIAERLLTLPTHHLLQPKDGEAIGNLFTSTESAQCSQPAILGSEEL